MADSHSYSHLGFLLAKVGRIVKAFVEDWGSKHRKTVIRPLYVRRRET